tara:strand:- start:3370 stop:5121 length:1752 start_codon:yes stop_codon:yes gene_type:complete
MYNVSDIESHFKLPIYHIKNKYKLTDDLINDLELIKTHYDDKSCKPMYDLLLNPTNDVSKITTKMWSKYYTNDKKFLNDSKKLYKKMNLKSQENEFNPKHNHFSEFKNLWLDVKNCKDFLTRYHFVDIKYFLSLNTNSRFLMYLSLYNITSPVLALISPIIILIIPFIILKIRNIPITISIYKSEINKLFGKHVIGQVIKNFKKVDFQKKMYLLCSVCFYFFQMYNNCQTCYRFYNNQKYLHNLINVSKKYIGDTINSMEKYLSYTDKLKTYSKFNDDIILHKNTLMSYLNKINQILPPCSNIKIIKNINQIGYLLKQFHFLRYNEELESSLFFSFGFNGYLENIHELTNNINTGSVNFCKFSNNKLELKKQFYPSLKDDPSVVKNTVNIDKNFIITGPNAAGKTTLIKSVMVNIIFSQQFGLGFYKSANIKLFKHLHCYINIPDTSLRDSLFQAEARRCKMIIDLIKDDPSEDHFCLFDELYSGTNPEEASASAYAFIDYLSKNNNVNFLLTTHFINVCERLKDNDNIMNLHMGTCKYNNQLIYKYTLEQGISTVKGGLEVLKQLEYPTDIVKSADIFDECG